MEQEPFNSLFKAGFFPEMSRHFIGFVERIEGAGEMAVLLAAGMVSRAAEAGHVCLDLTTVAGQPVSSGGAVDSDLVFPELGHWMTALRQSRVVGTPGDWRPLILDGSGRLYLHRYYHYEQGLADHLIQRCRKPPGGVSAERLKRSLSSHFPAGATVETDWQRVAAISAVLGRLSVISGGPGTGKTTVIARILTLLAEQSPGTPPRVLLAAPTGKAAARLGASVNLAREALPAASALRRGLPTEAFTIHRLLNVGGRDRRPAFSGSRLLPADIVVVDEASMVDLSLMTRLLTAIPESARLVILGDSHQLASVEAGSVFGDICHGASESRYSKSFVDTHRGLTGEALDVAVVDNLDPEPLLDAVTVLRKNFRFGDSGAIGRLSRCIAAGDADGALDVMSEGGSEVRWRRPGEISLTDLLRREALKPYGHMTAVVRPQEALAALDRYRILCAMRVGDCGVISVNNRVEKMLQERYRLSRGTWYPHRPVMIRKNDYPTRLFNGDCGIALENPNGDDTGLRVWFSATEGGFRAFHPYRIPDHETVFAMTVHKSQGSEYKDILIVLPESDAPVLTRELLYTAVTRARRRVTIWSRDAVIRTAVNRRTERHSGLRDRLWPSWKRTPAV